MQAGSFLDAKFACCDSVSELDQCGVCGGANDACAAIFLIEVAQLQSDLPSADETAMKDFIVAGMRGALTVLAGAQSGFPADVVELTPVGDTVSGPSEADPGGVFVSLKVRCRAAYGKVDRWSVKRRTAAAIVMLVCVQLAT